MSEAPELLRAYLRQRIELGEHEIFLETLAAREIIELAIPRFADAAVAAVRPRALIEPQTGADLVAIGDLADLRDRALGCRLCTLSETRNHVVFGEGSSTADVMVVGEAPGAEEDRTGRPFVGRAGKLLDTLLASVGFSREAVYICNVLKCRPPGNRNPLPAEIDACDSYLIRQVELVEPKVILACGTFAAQTLLESTEAIGRLRGAEHSYHGVPLIPTYHPAALLRNPAWIRPVWDDLQRLRTILDGS
ncbi:MAG TPA: uracil-DNA glycosylase [Longimicrobiaceae bacterium]|nr:uracil-DNA glycosylase [Longimicrobiaceae bacterium]